MAPQTGKKKNPKLGEDFHFDEHIFQRGWFNHQPENLGLLGFLRCFVGEGLVIEHL